jgi:hypothetical protein
MILLSRELIANKHRNSFIFDSLLVVSGSDGLVVHFIFTFLLVVLAALRLGLLASWLSLSFSLLTRLGIEDTAEGSAPSSS